MSAIARALGVLVAGTPFLFASPAAHATGGCAVDNAALSTTCSYVSGGGLVDLDCTLVAGLCQAKFAGGRIGGTCIAYALTTCGTHFVTSPGDVVTLTVYGGAGSVADEV